MLYAFDAFTVDTERCELRRNGELRPMRPKAYDLLLYLLERPGSVAGKNEILESVWPEVTVQESSLTQCIAHLRNALAPDGGGMIRTVPRRGYVLETDVARIETPAAAVAMPHRLRPARWVIATAFATGAATATVAIMAFGDPPYSLVSIEEIQPMDFTVASQTVLGQPLSAPGEALRIVAGIKTLDPGQTSTWHTHATPLFAYVLSGEVVVDYGAKGLRRYPTGAGFVEAIGTPHQGRNDGDQTAEFLVVSIEDADARE